MDTHIADPTLDKVSTFKARLPGEPVPGRGAGGGEAPLHAGDRTTPTAPKAKRKNGLLSGVAIIAVVVIAGGGFLISPYNNIVPVPPAMKIAGLHIFGKLAGQPKPVVARASNAAIVPPSPHVALNTPPHPAQPQQMATQPVNNPNLLAPSATLASVKPPAPPTTVVQPPYQPTASQQEMAELEGLQGGGTSQPAKAVPAKPGQSAMPKPPIAAASAHPTETQKLSPVAAQPDGPPVGYVPHEPGAASPPAPLAASSPSKGISLPPATAQTAAVVPPPVHPAALQKVSVSPSEALAVAPKVEAAPLSSPEQVQVLELVTQLATLIRDERTQIANLQADEQSGNKATAAKLGDFERRLALVEASSALAAASNVPASMTQAAPSGADTSVALMTAKAALSAAAKPTPVQPVVAVAVPVPSQPAVPQQYHVQAASPGLAMLTTVDRSGGDGSQIEVQVGDTLPGYGHVLSVMQQGTSWVVKTDSGLIQ